MNHLDKIACQNGASVNFPWQITLEPDLRPDSEALIAHTDRERVSA